MDKKRSKGVTIFAILSFLASFDSIFNLFTLKSRLIAYEATHFALPDNYYYVCQWHNFITAILGLIAGVGLWRLLKWARMFNIVTSILYYIYGIVFYLLYIRPHVIPYFIKINKPTYFFNPIW